MWDTPRALQRVCGSGISCHWLFQQMYCFPAQDYGGNLGCLFYALSISNLVRLLLNRLLIKLQASQLFKRDFVGSLVGVVVPDIV
jgi:hypothetical protein